MNNFLKKGVFANEKTYISNPFEKKIVNKSLYKIQILLFILTFSCIYSCLSPLAGPLLQRNRKSFQSADQIILHLCVETFLEILLV